MNTKLRSLIKKGIGFAFLTILSILLTIPVLAAVIALDKYGLYLSRATLPQGMEWGIVWVVANGLICAITIFVASIPALAIAVYLLKMKSSGKSNLFVKLIGYAGD